MSEEERIDLKRYLGDNLSIRLEIYDGKLKATLFLEKEEVDHDYVCTYELDNNKDNSDE